MTALYITIVIVYLVVVYGALALFAIRSARSDK